MKTPKQLPPSELATAPPLEAEPPVHKRLSRANSEHARLTDELRKLRAEWAKRNIKAQATRIPVSTAEITHVEGRRRELHLALERCQAEIGACNKELRENRAAKQAGANGKESKPKTPKQMPFRQDPEFDTYFHLAARDQLTRELYEAIVRTAKSMMFDAAKMGLREGGDS